MSTKVLFVRHGPTRWNLEGRIQGHSDIPLSAEGRSAVTSWSLHNDYFSFDWVTSHLQRTQETARLLGVDQFATDPRLAEADWGEWEGLVLTELRAEMGETLRRNEARGLDLTPPGGETPRQVRDRLAVWLREIAAAGRDTVAVSHNGVLRAAYSLATDWDMTGQPEIERGHHWAHLYAVEPDGRLTILQLNIRLGPKRTAT